MRLARWCGQRWSRWLLLATAIYLFALSATTGLTIYQLPAVFVALAVLAERFLGGVKLSDLNDETRRIKKILAESVDVSVTAALPSATGADFVPQTFEVNLYSVRGAGGHAARRPSHALNLTLPDLVLACEDSRVLLVGESGSGKSLTCLQSIQGVARRHNHAANPEPLWLPLSVTRGREFDSMAAWLAHELLGLTSARMAAELVGSGRVLPVLDGLDEVSQVELDVIVRLLNAWRVLGRPGPFVAAARPTLLNRVTNNLGHTSVYRFGGLYTTQVADFFELIQRHTKYRESWHELTMRLRAMEGRWTDGLDVLAAPWKTVLAWEVCRSDQDPRMVFSSVDSTGNSSSIEQTLWAAFIPSALQRMRRSSPQRRNLDKHLAFLLVAMADHPQHAVNPAEWGSIINAHLRKRFRVARFVSSPVRILHTGGNLILTGAAISLLVLALPDGINATFSKQNIASGSPFRFEYAISYTLMVLVAISWLVASCIVTSSHSAEESSGAARGPWSISRLRSAFLLALVTVLGGAITADVLDRSGALGVTASALRLRGVVGGALAGAAFGIVLVALQRSVLGNRPGDVVRSAVRRGLAVAAATAFATGSAATLVGGSRYAGATAAALGTIVFILLGSTAMRYATACALGGLCGAPPRPLRFLKHLERHGVVRAVTEKYVPRHAELWESMHKWAREQSDT